VRDAVTLCFSNDNAKKALPGDAWEVWTNGRKRVSLAPCSRATRESADDWSVTAMISLTINGKSVSVDAESDTPLLWVIRDDVGLTGTKFGCGVGMCGACTVHIDGKAVRSCITPVSAVKGAVTTIEGLDPAGAHPVQTAWKAVQVPQCGYCQSGQIMQAAAFLKDHPSPTDKDIDAAMSGNLCRCMTYNRIRAAIREAAKSHAAAKPAARKASATATGGKQ
jgi:isoquinoline 1-oxidoreductase alpha subunit